MALVNALVVVAALSAVAAALTIRSQDAGLRLAQRQAADQLTLHLQAATALAQRQIAAAAAQGMHHPGQDWARPRAGIEIDGSGGPALLGWQIDDLQGRFNVNWLAAPSPAPPENGNGGGGGPEAWRHRAEAALAILGSRHGNSPAADDRLAAAVRATAGGDPGIAEAGPGGAGLPPGPLPLPEPLLAAGGIDDPARLLPLLAALPADSALNVNTVHPEVLAALLPGVAPQAVAALLAAGRPFADVDAFRDGVLDRLVPPELSAHLTDDRLAVRSSWFEARLTAVAESPLARGWRRGGADDIAQGRRVILHAGQTPGGGRVVLSIPTMVPAAPAGDP